MEIYPSTPPPRCGTTRPSHIMLLWQRGSRLHMRHCVRADRLTCGFPFVCAGVCVFDWVVLHCVLFVTSTFKRVLGFVPAHKAAWPVNTLTDVMTRPSRLDAQSQRSRCTLVDSQLIIVVHHQPLYDTWMATFILTVENWIMLHGHRLNSSCWWLLLSKNIYTVNRKFCICVSNYFSLRWK